jgi:hypothetical protein
MDVCCTCTPSIQKIPVHVFAKPNRNHIAKLHAHPMRCGRRGTAEARAVSWVPRNTVALLFYTITHCSFKEFALWLSDRTPGAVRPAQSARRVASGSNARHKARRPAREGDAPGPVNFLNAVTFGLWRHPFIVPARKTTHQSPPRHPITCSQWSCSILLQYYYCNAELGGVHVSSTIAVICFPQVDSNEPKDSILGLVIDWDQKDGVQSKTDPKNISGIDMLK